MAHRVTRVGERMRCEIVPLERVYGLAVELAREIRRAGFAPELVVAIARGGFVPARLLCDFLGVPVLASFAIRHYAAGARSEGSAQLRHPLAADVRGQRVLVVDDVNDSGETLAAAPEHLASREPAEARFAVIHEKGGTRARADFRAEAVEAGPWLVYQWALVEDVNGFLDDMAPRPATAREARERLAAEYGLELSDAQWRTVNDLGASSLR
jgi:hypoxanthine phosphoribosyltransferase